MRLNEIRLTGTLALFYQNQGQYAAAEPLYQRSLPILENGLGPNHPNVAQLIENMAALYEAKGQDDQAQLLAARAKQIRESRQ